jgi:pimeloyl-ACP methyl ester carboxylesterase
MPGSIRALTSRLSNDASPPRRITLRAARIGGGAGRRGTPIDGLCFALSEVLARRKSLFRLSGALKSVRVPTLVMVGELDYAEDHQKLRPYVAD